MILLYVLTNHLDGLLIDSYVTKSTDDLYIATNLANERPSLPYRTEAGGIGAAGDPEYICVDLGSPKAVTFVGIFNHNFTQMQDDDDLLTLKGCDGDCPGQSDACEWEHSGICFTDLQSLPADPCDGCVGEQPIENHKNLWHKVDCGIDYRYWLLEMIDTTNTNGHLELGELVLGEWKQFPRGILTGDDSWVRLSPGRVDGPEFFMGKSRTHWGQDWSTYYSEYERFDLVLTTQNDPCIVDAIHTFLKAVQLTGGRFVLVPDDNKPFCYYVIVDNLRDYAERKIYGRTRELREWKFKLKSLTEGVKLL